jgi:hypothetical protein
MTLHTLSPNAIRDLSYRLKALESASRPYLREYRTPFLGEEGSIQIGKTVDNGDTYPVGTSPNNSFWVEFGSLTFDDTAIGDNAVTWESYSPPLIKVCRTLCGGWVEQGIYVSVMNRNGSRFIIDPPRFYYGISSGAISAASGMTLGTGIVTIVTEAGSSVDLAVSNFSSAIDDDKNCFVWRHGNKFLVAEICP